jgi:aminopeptidase N
MALWSQAAETRMRATDAAAGAQLAWAQAFASAARAPGQLDLLAALLDGSETIAGLEMNAELRWAALRGCVAASRAGADEIAAELRRDPTAAGRRQAAAARAAMPAPEAKEAAWQLLTGVGNPANAMVEAVAAGFAQAEQSELLAPYTARYFAMLDELYAARGHEIGRRLVTGLFPSLQIGPDTVAATDEWLAAARRDPTLRRLVLEARDDLLRALRARETDRTSRSAVGGKPAEDG